MLQYVCCKFTDADSMSPSTSHAATAETVLEPHDGMLQEMQNNTYSI